MIEDVTGCRVEPVTGPLTVRVVREAVARTPEQAAGIAAAWDRLCASNPRYFNGRILAFESYDPLGGIAVARDEEYRTHAVKRWVDLGLAFFGITGVLCVGAGGTERYMLARRGDSVHDYPGQWEFGPCGGIDPPAATAGDTLSPADLARELAREASEELGIDLTGAELTHLALVHDRPQIGSTDLMVRCRLASMPATAANWEVSGTRWVTLDELIAWGERSPDEIIPTTRALGAWLAKA